MIDLKKSLDYFQPSSLGNSRCHIIGCGSVGGNIAVALARLGVTKMTLYDFDKVESHNLANQVFRQQDVGVSKVDALISILAEINPDIEKTIKVQNEGWKGQTLSGYVFLAPDSIEVRRQVVEGNRFNTHLKAMFDFRTGLEGAQTYAADWSNPKHIENLLNSMDFTDEEAHEHTPVSACGTTLGLGSIPRMIADLGVNNWLNFVRIGELKTFIMLDGFKFSITSF